MMARTNRKADKTDWVVSPPDEFHPTFGGAGMLMITEGFKPKPEELRQMLLDLRRIHRWSQGFAASILGVQTSTIVKWEARTRNPSGSAAKLVFFLYAQLVERKNRVRNCWDLAVWGKIPCRSEDFEKLTNELIALNGTYFVPEEEMLKVVGGEERNPATQ